MMSAEVQALSVPSQDETYECFTNAFDIPYTVVTAIYIITLFVISLIVAVWSWTKPGDTERNCYTKFNGWLVRLVFGRSEGIPDDTAGQGCIIPLQEGKNIVKSQDIVILGTIVICISLLIGIAAYGVYLLEVTHTCSEDPAIYCFPRFIDERNPENPNITAAEMKYPITDCSVWVNSSIAPLITFQCFKYAFNAQAALATAGGLLAFFTVAMRATISIFLKLFGCKCCDDSNRCIKFLQIIMVIMLLLFNGIFATVVMSFQLASKLEMLPEMTPVAQQIGSYLTDNGLQLLIFTGTANLLLLISWKEYVDKDSKPSNKSKPSKPSKDTEMDDRQTSS
jgi:hypothetical protein